LGCELQNTWPYGLNDCIANETVPWARSRMLCSGCQNITSSVFACLGAGSEVSKEKVPAVATVLVIGDDGGLSGAEDGSGRKFGP
jgi:hypothetical protein